MAKIRKRFKVQGTRFKNYNVNAYYRIYGPLRNTNSYSLEELNENIKKQVILANQKPFQKREGSRLTDFLTHEKGLLSPLPGESYVYKHKVKAKVRKDYHIILGEDKNFYSVPYQNVGQSVDVVYDTEEVSIYLNMKQIAVHKRSYGKYKYITCKEHLHPRHLVYKNQIGWDSEYFLNIMVKVGPNSSQITQNILASRTYPEQSFNSCCGLIKLLKAYGNTRFENACTRALLGKTHTYLTLKNILEKNLDTQLSISFNENYIPNHENIRGHKSYL